MPPKGRWPLLSITSCTTTRPWVTSGVERAADDPYILERVGEFTAALKASVALADSAALVVQTSLAKGHDVTARERGEAAAEAYARQGPRHPMSPSTSRLVSSK